MKKTCRLIIPAVVLIFSACLSTEPSVELTAPARETQTEQPPSWITSQPKDSAGDYIGISGSNTGIESDDRDLAYDKALKSLAGAIYTEVSAASSLTESEDGEGYESSYENNIETSVASNLADIETMDSYYSEDLGYWIYLRLSRARWNMLVEERAREMKDLAEDLFLDIFPDTLTELKVIGRGMDEYYHYYSGKPIKMELLGKRGAINNILTLRAEELLGELAIQWSPLPDKLTAGKPAALSGRVVLTDSGSGVSYENPGAVTLALKDEENRELRRFQTERDGSFALEFTDSRPRASADYSLTMESPYGDSLLKEMTAYRLPSAHQTTEVKAFVLPVKVESSWENGDLPDRTRNFLRGLQAAEMSPWTEENQSGYLLARISFRQAPPNDFGMIISYATLYISYITDDGEVSLWKSGEYKDGGLNEDQANQRASEKLFSGPNDIDGLKNVLSQLN